MPVLPSIVTPEDYAADALDIVGERFGVRASGKATGSYEIFLQGGPEGSPLRGVNRSDPWLT